MLGAIDCQNAARSCRCGLPSPLRVKECPLPSEPGPKHQANPGKSSSTFAATEGCSAWPCRASIAQAKCDASAANHGQKAVTRSLNVGDFGAVWRFNKE